MQPPPPRNEPRVAGLPFGLNLGEESVVTLMPRSAAWWETPPSPGHQRTEGRVGKREHPERRLVVEHSLNPVFDEAAFIAHFSSPQPKRGLKLCEGAVLHPGKLHGAGKSEMDKAYI